MDRGAKIPCNKNALKASRIASEVNKKRVSQYDFNGNIINTFESSIEAEAKTGVNKKGISEKS